MRIFGRNSRRGEESEHWIGVSDMMSGLMMVFLFLSVALMRSALDERDRIKSIAEAYDGTQSAIYQSLAEEFGSDLEKWGAKINKATLAVEFFEIDSLFAFGSSELKPEFEKLLDDFFPRYMKTLEPYKDSISEIRIEGHASSYWSARSSKDQAYANNMVLSQARTRSVLFYIQAMPQMNSQKSWLRKNVAAIGFSSGRVVTDSNGREIPRASRRVEFRILTNADQQIRRILEKSREAED